MLAASSAVDACGFTGRMGAYVSTVVSGKPLPDAVKLGSVIVGMLTGPTLA